MESGGKKKSGCHKLKQKRNLPAKHHLPVALAKISMNMRSRMRQAAMTIPAMAPAVMSAGRASTVSTCIILFQFLATKKRHLISG